MLHFYLPAMSRQHRDGVKRELSWTHLRWSTDLIVSVGEEVRFWRQVWTRQLDGELAMGVSQDSLLVLGRYHLGYEACHTLLWWACGRVVEVVVWVHRCYTMFWWQQQSAVQDEGYKGTYQRNMFHLRKFSQKVVASSVYILIIRVEMGHPSIDLIPDFGIFQEVSMFSLELRTGDC